jgi:hypothetical protein
VAGGEQGLDAAAGPEVEHRSDTAPDGEPSEEQRRGIEADHVVAPQGTRFRRIPGEDETLRDREADPGPDLAVPVVHEAEPHCFAQGEGRERDPGLCLGDGNVESKELHEAVEGRRRPQPPEVEWQVDAAGLGPERYAEHLRRLGTEIAVSFEGRPKPGDAFVALGIEHGRYPLLRRTVE